MLTFPESEWHDVILTALDPEGADFLPGDPDGNRYVKKLPETREEWLAAAFPEGGPEQQGMLKAAQKYVDGLAKERLKIWEAEERAAEYTVGGTDLDEFLGEEEPPTDWVVPGLLGRQDRIIVTGLEGSGKSMLSRQVAMCAASGIHPFDLAALPVKPARVLIIDLENPTDLARQSLRALRITAGDRYQKGNMTVTVKPEGMDLVGNDGAELRAEIEKAGDIDLLVIGPLYKMVSVGDVTEEPVARELTATLDRLRIEFGFALWIEAHAPHQQSEDKKPTVKRPYGASLFKRWPEFGYFLHWDPESGVGELQRWRQDRRSDRHYPDQLRRGGAWPWTHPTSEKDIIWTPIQHAAEKYAAENKGKSPSLRILATETGMSKSSLERFLKDEAYRWDALKAALLERHAPEPTVHAGQTFLDPKVSQQDL